MKNSYLLAALPILLLAAPAARAQAEFRPGYIVPTAGDTVSGEIDLRDHYFNNMQCRFRPSVSAETRTYRPGELVAYGVPAAGQHYRTIVPPPSSTPYFGEVLVGGPASLYTLRDADRADHYYLDAPQFALAELVYYRTMEPGQMTLREDPRYRLTLQQAMPNCPAAEGMLPRLAFREDDLRRVVRAFNACQGQVWAPLARARQPARLGVLVGGQLIGSSLTFTPLNYMQPTTFDLPTQGGLLLGVRLGLPLPTLSRLLALETELNYAHQRYTESFGSNTTFGGLHQSFGVTLSYLRLPVLLRYAPVARVGVRPVLEFGPTLAYAVQLITSYTTVDYYNRLTTSELLPNNQRRLQEGLMGGVGLDFPYWQARRVALLLRYEADTGWTEGNDLRSSANRFYALLAFDLTQ